MADELAELEKEVAKARKEGDRYEERAATVSDKDERAARKAALEEELARQKARSEPDSAHDDVVLPGRKDGGKDPENSASTTAASKEGN
jgi:hypothetical protein